MSGYACMYVEARGLCPVSPSIVLRLTLSFILLLHHLFHERDTRHSMYMEVIRQLQVVGSLLPPGGSQADQHSGCHS